MVGGAFASHVGCLGGRVFGGDARVISAGISVGLSMLAACLLAAAACCWMDAAAYWMDAAGSDSRLTINRWRILGFL